VADGTDRFVCAKKFNYDLLQDFTFKISPYSLVVPARKKKGVIIFGLELVIRNRGLKLCGLLHLPVDLHRFRFSHQTFSKEKGQILTRYHSNICRCRLAIWGSKLNLMTCTLDFALRYC